MMTDKGYVELLHYSDALVGPIHSCKQKEPRMYGKPIGFWVSADNDWELWCRDEDFELQKLTIVHLVTLQSDANILHLSSADDIDQFTEKYRVPIRYPGFTFDSYGIDWRQVSECYQGIIIAPYIWDRRLMMFSERHTDWYYPWDCASGCIWDSMAVASVVPIDVSVPTMCHTNAEIS